MKVSCSGSGGSPAGELLGQVDRAGHLHRVRRRAVDGDIGGLVGGRVDTQACAGGPHLGLVDVGDLALERQLLVVGAGQLQPAQHPALTGLPPRLVARPQHADGEPAVGVEAGAQVAPHRGRALFLADLLDARRRRRGRVGPVLAAGEGAHIHRLGDLEAVLVVAVDDLGGIRGAVRPVQAVAALGVVEGVVAARSQRDGAGGQPRWRLRWGSAVIRPAISRPPSAVNSSARRVEVACRLLHHVTRFDGCLASVVELVVLLGYLQHPLHCDRRVGCCDK